MRHVGPRVGGAPTGDGDETPPTASSASLGDKGGHLESPPAGLERLVGEGSMPAS